jgi:DNA-binding NtrC family response regulator
MARVLVIDDDVETLNGLSDFLRLKGHEVRVSAHGVSALDSTSGWEPEVVLLDFLMPGLSGADVLRALKDSAPDSSVIVITGRGDPNLARHFLELGAREFIRKPIDFDYLELTISWELKLRNLRKKAA